MVVPGALRARVSAMVHEGHLGIVMLRQRCRGLVWWPGIDKEIEALVRDCSACLVSGKTSHYAPPPLQPSFLALPPLRTPTVGCLL